MTVDALGTFYGLAAKTVTKLLANLETTERGPRRYYNKETAAPILEAYVSDKASLRGETIRDGKVWARVEYFHRRFGLSYTKLNAELAKITTTEGINGVMLYDIDEATLLLSPFVDAPHVDKVTGIYTDENNTQWAHVTIIANLFNISIDKLNEFLNPENAINLKGGNKIIVSGYNIAEVRERAKDYVVIPTEEEYLRNHRDEKIIDASSLATEYGCSLDMMRRILAEMAIDLRGSGRIKRYPEVKARQTLDKIKALPEVTKDADEYTDAEGNRYALSESIRDKIQIGRNSIYQALGEGSVGSITVRKGMAMHTMYKLSDLEAYRDRPRPERPQKASPAKVIKPKVERKPQAPKEKKERIIRGRGLEYWKGFDEPTRNALLESEGQMILDAGGVLSDQSLRKGGTSSFRRAALEFYPGGLAGLREKLGVGDTVKKRRQWKKTTNVENVLLAEGRKIMKENGGDFTAEFLISKKLYYPIHQKYPGGYLQFRKDLGLDLKRRTKADITPEKIKNDVQAFIAEHGRFASSLAEKVGRGDLSSAVRYHYPGGVNQILIDIGQPINRREWTPANIESEALAIFKAKGELSYSLLNQVPGLKMAINRHYPGMIEALKAKVNELASQQPE